MQHKVSNMQIYYSTDYSLFKLMDGNRFLNERKIKRISTHISNGLNFLRECPIICMEKNNRLEIIDGQHRFWVSKSLKMPVYYVVTNPVSLEDIAKLNDNSERWKNHDYINLYVNNGNKNYITIQKFLDDYKISLTSSLRILRFGGMNNERDLRIGPNFKAGKFEVTDIKSANKVGEATKLFYRYPKYKSRQFLAALTILINQGEDLQQISEASKSGLLVTPFLQPAAYVRHLKSFLENN